MPIAETLAATAAIAEVILVVSLAWATQQAIYDLLTQDATITELTEQADGTAGVWEFTPTDPNASYPHITFQEVTAQHADTFGRGGKNMLWDINVWSTQPGESETTTIFDRITTILEQGWGNASPLSYDGVNFIMVHEESGPRPLPDPNKGIRRMNATYRIIAQQSTTP